MDIKQCIKSGDDGRPVLGFHHLFMSDIHWGTHASRAKALCRVFPNIQTQGLTLVGDIVDGWHMSQKDSWNMGDYHRQGMAHVLRMKTDKTYIPGNHEDNLRGQVKAFSQHDDREMMYRRLVGGDLFDLKVRQDCDYVDPNGKRYFVCHGDEFDPQLYSQNDGFWYHFGDKAISKFAHIDHRVNEKMGWEEFSSCARLKSAFKAISERVTGVKERAAEFVKSEGYDGLIYGHSHISGFDYRDGVALINDGCATDNAPEFLAVSDNGEKALLKWHKDYLRVTAEDNSVQHIPWNLLDMDGYGRLEPELIEDEYTQQADRLLRIMYRMWPGQDREKGDPVPVVHPRHQVEIEGPVLSA